MGYDAIERIDEHKISDSPDSAKGMYCTECYSRWPCGPSIDREIAREAYRAAREQHTKDPDDWAAILRAADIERARRRDIENYRPYDYDVPASRRVKQNPVYIFDIPDRRG